MATTLAPEQLATLSKDEILRYSRHLIMPEVGMEGQQKLKAARVLCIGTGGLGSPLALYLTAAGVGTIGLVDFDVVDFTTFNTRLTSANALEIFRDFDIIIDGTDNFPTRFLINDACVFTGKPNV